MDNLLIDSLAINAPGILGVIVVVVIFVRYLEKKDSQFLTTLDKITNKLDNLESIQQQHITLYMERGKVIDRIDKAIRALKE